MIERAALPEANSLEASSVAVATLKGYCNDPDRWLPGEVAFPGRDAPGAERAVAAFAPFLPASIAERADEKPRGSTPTIPGCKTSRRWGDSCGVMRAINECLQPR